MAILSNSKLWVGPDRHLMAAVIKSLERSYYYEHPSYNKDAVPNPQGLFISETGHWCYSKSKSRKEGTGVSFVSFATSDRKEIQLSDVLPVLSAAALRSTKIRTGTLTLNITVQEALKASGIGWCSGPVVQYADKAEYLYIDSRGGLTYTDFTVSEYFESCQGTEIFPHQIPGIITTLPASKTALRCIKIHVNIPGISSQVQQILFAEGCRWQVSGVVVACTHCPYLYVDSTGEISYGHGAYNFDSHQYSEVLAADLIGKTYSSQTNTQQHDTTGKTQRDARSEGGRGAKVRIDECKIASEPRLRENGVRAVPSTAKVGRRVLRGTLLSGQDYGG